VWLSRCCDDVGQVAYARRQSAYVAMSRGDGGLQLRHRRRSRRTGHSSGQAGTDAASPTLLSILHCRRRENSTSPFHARAFLRIAAASLVPLLMSGRGASQGARSSTKAYWRLADRTTFVVGNVHGSRLDPIDAARRVPAPRCESAPVRISHSYKSRAHCAPAGRQAARPPCLPVPL